MQSTTIRGILNNEKYKGDVLQGKTFTVDPISHKRLKNMGEEDKYYIKSHHTGIISAEIFDKVQEIMQGKCGARATGRRLGNIGRKYPMSSRLKCGFCGGTLVRRSLYSNKKQTNPAWLCVEAAKFGKEYCPESKIVREDIIEGAFIDAYQLLSNKENLALDDFLEIMKKSIRDNTPKEKMAKLLKQKEDTESKILKLADLAVDGTIDNETFRNKKEHYNSKILKYEKEIEQLELIVEDDNSIEKGIAKFKESLNSDSYLNEFDGDLFDALVDYVVVGGFVESGQKQPYMTRYICKNKFRFSNREEITKEQIVTNNQIQENNINQYIPILDFISSQHFIVFEKDEKGKINKRIINNVRVRVEVER